MRSQGGGYSPSQIPSVYLVPFLMIVFGLAWGLFAVFIFASDWVVAQFGALSGHHPLFILAVYAPAIAALLLIGITSGFSGLGRFLSRLFLWRASPGWYVFLVLGFPAISFAGALIKGNALSAPMFTEPLTALLPAIGFMLILGPMEEIGWRGFALPILQRRLAPFWAGLILGVIWAVWHLPAFMLSGTPQAAWSFLPFFLGSIACSLILTALFNDSRGSILLAMLFHFQMNNPLWPDAQPHDMYVYVLAGALIVWLNRRSLFSRERAVTEILPGHRAAGVSP
ncbi:MAG: CPBP family intramembrane metalloprotease [Alphaproteobacteria bacterium HGW-Alphaproteobacteria-18]|nr:MAG: CPBP family intramembrane metalloprotease [Alphaproteobacteria bacterium HGW-Alphaproteobacteria-18]